MTNSSASKSYYATIDSISKKGIFATFYRPFTTNAYILFTSSTDASNTLLFEEVKEKKLYMENKKVQVKINFSFAYRLRKI